MGDAGVVPDAVPGPRPIQAGGVEGGHRGQAVLLETLQLRSVADALRHTHTHTCISFSYYIGRSVSYLSPIGGGCLLFEHIFIFSNLTLLVHIIVKLLLAAFTCVRLGLG